MARTFIEGSTCARIRDFLAGQPRHRNGGFRAMRFDRAPSADADRPTTISMSSRHRAKRSRGRDPFTFTRDGDRYLGRGTTDDKGPALTGAVGNRRRASQRPLNLRVLWELEEEIGSPELRGAMAEHKRQLATDSVVVSDTIWGARNRPACPAGLRGLPASRLVLKRRRRSTLRPRPGAARNRWVS